MVAGGPRDFVAFAAVRDTDADRVTAPERAVHVAQVLDLPSEGVAQDAEQFLDSPGLEASAAIFERLQTEGASGLSAKLLDFVFVHGELHQTRIGSSQPIGFPSGGLPVGRLGPGRSARQRKNERHQPREGEPRQRVTSVGDPASREAGHVRPAALW